MIEKQLFKYLFKEFTPVFLFSNLVVIFILIMFQMLNVAQSVIGHEVSLIEFSKLIFAIVGALLPASLPISSLASTNMVIGRMSSDSELIALISSGVPVRALMKIFSIVSILIVLIMIVLTQWIGPKSNDLFNTMLAEFSSRNFSVNVKPGVFIENFYGMTLYTEQTSSEASTMSHVFINDERDSRLPMVITAKSGKVGELQESRLNLDLFDGEMHLNRADGSYQKILFDDYTLNINIAFNFQKGRAQPIAMTGFDLSKELSSMKNNPARDNGLYRWMYLEYYRRFALSLSCLLFINMGILWACGHFRSMRGRPIVTSLIITVIYWCIFLVCDSLGRQAKLHLDLAVWLPNLVTVMFLGLMIFFKRRYV